MAFNVLDASISAINEGRRKAIKTVSLQAVEMITDRVQQEGKASSGRKMAKYSAAYALVRSKGKAKGQSGSLQTAHVDLTVTGQMMNNLKVIKTGTRAAKIGFSNKEAQDKANNTTNLKGTWIKPTKGEQAEIREAFADVLSDVIGKVNKKTVFKI